MKFFWICCMLSLGGCALQVPKSAHTVFEYKRTFEGDVFARALSASKRMGFEVLESDPDNGRVITSAVDDSIALCANCGTYLGVPMNGPCLVRLEIRVSGQVAQVWATVHANVLGQDNFGQAARHQYQCRSNGGMEKRFLAAMAE